MKNYFNYYEWEDISYDKLLIHLHQKYSTSEINKILKKEISSLKYITKDQLKIILSKFGDMSIFKSKLNIPIMQNKIFCQYCRSFDLKESNIKTMIKKILKKESFKELIDEIYLNIIFNEVLKIKNNEKYKIILQNNYN